MTDSTLQAFRAISEAMQTEPTDWQWIGEWDSQRMFGITETRAKDFAANYGGVAEKMVTESMREATAKHHQKMARVLRKSGREADAKSADRAAKLCRERA